MSGLYRRKEVGPPSGTELAVLSEEVLTRFRGMVEAFWNENDLSTDSWYGPGESTGCGRWMTKYYAAAKGIDPLHFASRSDYLVHLLELVGQIREDDCPIPRRAIDTVTRVLIGHLTGTDEARLAY